MSITIGMTHDNKIIFYGYNSSNCHFSHLIKWDFLAKCMTRPSTKYIKVAICHHGSIYPNQKHIQNNKLIDDNYDIMDYLICNTCLDSSKVKAYVKLYKKSERLVYSPLFLGEYRTLFDTYDNKVDFDKHKKTDLVKFVNSLLDAIIEVSKKHNPKHYSNYKYIDLYDDTTELGKLFNDIDKHNMESIKKYEVLPVEIYDGAVLPWSAGLYNAFKMALVQYVVLNISLMFELDLKEKHKNDKSAMFHFCKLAGLLGCRHVFDPFDDAQRINIAVHDILKSSDIYTTTKFLFDRIVTLYKILELYSGKPYVTDYRDVIISAIVYN